MGLQGEVARVDRKGCNTVLADRMMALAGPQDSLARAVHVGHKDSQVGVKVGLAPRTMHQPWLVPQLTCESLRLPRLDSRERLHGLN